jgi:Tfp pilus assembly protein PilO
MNRDRLWGLIWFAAVAAVVLLGTFLGIVPQIDEAKSASRELKTVEAQNAEHELALAALKIDYEHIDELRDDLVELQVGVPLAADIPAFVAEIDAIGTQNQVTLEQISISDGTGYVPVETVAADEEDATADAASTGAAVPTSSRLTTANYISVPVSIEASGTSDAVLDFLSGLQYGDRILAINGFSTEAGTAADDASVTISAEIYVLVDPFATTTD